MPLQCGRGRALSAPIAIAGAGIAGLSAAIALKLAGFEARIFEREAELLPVGAGLQLGPNATRLLLAWGVVLGEASAPGRLVFRSLRAERVLNELPLGATALERYGAPYLTMLRASLQHALLRRARELGVEIGFGAPVEGMEARARDGVVRAGGTGFEARALIGADGLRSRIRQGLFPGIEPKFSGATAFRATLAAEDAPDLFRANEIGLWMGSGAHLVHYPVERGRLVNAVLILEDDWRSLPLQDLHGLDFLLARFSGSAAGFIALLHAAGIWHPWPIHTLPRLPAWHGGRVCLIGDAAHAMVPYLASGGVMAIEDAASLAEAFKAAGGGAEAAFAAYDKTRRQRLALVSARSQLMGRIYHFPEPGAFIRDAVIALAPSSRLLARNDWLYGFSPKL